MDNVLFIDRIESVNDMYSIRENEHCEIVKVPYTDFLSGNITPASTRALIDCDLT